MKNFTKSQGEDKRYFLPGQLGDHIRGLCFAFPDLLPVSRNFQDHEFFKTQFYCVLRWILGADRVRKVRYFAAICRILPTVSPLNSINATLSLKLAVRRSGVRSPSAPPSNLLFPFYLELFGISLFDRQSLLGGYLGVIRLFDVLIQLPPTEHWKGLQQRIVCDQVISEHT